MNTIEADRAYLNCFTQTQAQATCAAKKSFPCRMAAESALAMMRSMAKSKHCAGLYDAGHVYICPVCSHWHITRAAQFTSNN